MENNQEDNLDDDYFKDKQYNFKKKQQILKNQIDKKDMKIKKQEKTKKEKNERKSRFLLLGIVLIIIGSACFVTINELPLLYVKYEQKLESENLTIERLYYQDIQISDEYDQKIKTFFDSDSGQYLGVSTDDFSPYIKICKYLSYMLVGIGIVFTLTQIAFKFVVIENKKALLLHSLFAASGAVLCVYLIFISVKFFAAFILYLLNYKIIAENLTNPVITFVTPIIIIFIVSIGLKICFVILKIDYNELEKTLESKKPKKSMLDFRYKGDVKWIQELYVKLEQKPILFYFLQF